MPRRPRRPGRPSDSTKIPSEHFAARYRAVFTQLIKRDGFSPTQKDIAGALGITTVTLRRYCEKANIVGGSSG